MERIISDTMPLGDRIKSYEHQFTGYTIDSSLPFIARVDGKAFHTYTKRMRKPFDDRFVKAMQETAKKLTETFDPILSYVQSDEITLLFKPTAEPFLSGKLSKMNSIIETITNIANNTGSMNFKSFGSIAPSVKLLCSIYIPP